MVDIDQVLHEGLLRHEMGHKATDTPPALQIYEQNMLTLRMQVLRSPPRPEALPPGRLALEAHHFEPRRNPFRPRHHRHLVEGMLTSTVWLQAPCSPALSQLEPEFHGAECVHLQVGAS